MNHYPLTAEQVRALLSYDPETGIFTWRNTGKTAGWATTHSGLCLIIDDHTFRLHRLAWLYVHGEWSTKPIRHRDGDKHNNRIANLFESTPTEIAWTRAKRIDNTSGVIGVRHNPAKPEGKRWESFIGVAGRLRYLGAFSTKELAAEVRRAAEKQYFRNE